MFARKGCPCHETGGTGTTREGRVQPAGGADILADGEPGFAVSRAYYAMFYCAQALLLSLGQSYSSHAATIAAFGERFAKAGLMEAKFHRYLIDAYAARQVGDYEPIKKVSENAARRTIVRGQEFLEVTRIYLHREEETGNTMA